MSIDKQKETSYTYDINGNILTKTTNGQTIEYKYQENSDKLVAFGNELFEYDVLGNPTKFRGMTATWEKGRRLKSLNDGTNTVQYTYDGTGLRQSKTVGNITTTYTYDSNDRLIKEEGLKTIEYIYGNDGIIGIKINGTPYLFRKNLFGDITHIIDSTGNLVGKYSYTAHGECTIETDIAGVATDNPIRYRGYYYDEDTNLYYLKSRYYDPEIGRFITIDDIGYLDPQSINGLNLYCYCLNNPIMRVDTSGHLPEWLRDVIDIGLYVVSAVVATIVGVAVSSVATPVVGIAAGVATFGALNNLTNAIYYNNFSNDTTSLTSNSYTNKYINRWDRLDYAKKETKQSSFNITTWMYFSEYNFHMYAWYMLSWADEKNIDPFSKWAGSAKVADIKIGKLDGFPVNVGTIILGLLGL